MRLKEIVETKGIVVWDFHQAPEILRKLSTSAGDEDWLALVPSDFKNRWIPWLEEGHFGNSVEKIELPSGETVFIGSHA